MNAPNKSPIDCVGIVCFRGSDVLLIRRGKPPRAGEWSIPGGRIHDGETHIEAAHRELVEETSIKARSMNKIETIHAQFERYDYLLHDYVAEWVSGEPQAGDDAAHAEFVPLTNIHTLGMWSETVRIIHKAQQIYFGN